MPTPGRVVDSMEVTAFAENAIAIRPKPAGTPSKYGTPDVLHGLTVEYTRLMLTMADSTSTDAITNDANRYQTFQ